MSAELAPPGPSTFGPPSGSVREVRFRAGGVGAARANPDLPDPAPGAAGASDTGVMRARPVRWLGAPAPGGLALPAATPTASQLYAPRGVWIDDERLIVCDTGNHRVLIWNDHLGADHLGADHLSADHLRADHADADVVLGQADFRSEGAQAAGRGPAKGMRLPTGVLVHEGRLVVADAWNHRLLVWDDVPSTSDTAPDHVIGQPGPEAVEPNRGEACSSLGFWWPFGIAMVGGRLHVADTGNRRVLVWDGIPEPNAGPAVVLGQPSAACRDENRGELGPHSFRWPHDIAGTSSTTFVADAGNHRILGWHGGIDTDRSADLVLGQPDFVSGSEFPYAPQTPATVRFPYAIAVDRIGEHDRMAVADTANNRILLWDAVPDASRRPAVAVLGQHDFRANGENRWDAVRHDTFCWPYGISLHGRHLAVADSGNNRVTIWAIETTDARALQTGRASGPDGASDAGGAGDR